MANRHPPPATRRTAKRRTMTSNDKRTELTRGEEEIMQILWRLGDAVVNEIIPLTNEPHPKYTTVATFLKILENKGFVRHEAEGKSHRYYPTVTREGVCARRDDVDAGELFRRFALADGILLLAARADLDGRDGGDSRDHAPRPPITPSRP